MAQTSRSPGLDVEPDLVPYARQAVENCLKRVVAGCCKMKAPKLNGLMRAIPGAPFHPLPELFIQLAGRDSIEFPTERFDLYPGQICVMPKGMPHRETMKLDHKRLEMLTFIHLPPEYLWVALSGGPGSHNNIPQVLKSGTIAHPSVVRVGEHLDDIAHVSHLREHNHREIVRHLLAAYLERLINILDSDKGTSVNEPPKVAQAKHLIVSRMSDPNLSVGQLAAQIECAPDYLSFLFHKWTGKTLIDTINSHRLSQAQYLLRNTVKNVKEIANQVGFADRAYFGRMFRRATGQTPMTFRRNASAEFPSSPD